MVKRLHLEAGRLVLSRPGYAASPTLDNARKILDSEWGYAGQLIASGAEYDPAPRVLSNGRFTNTNSPWDIPFPDPGYIPTVIFSVESQYDNGRVAAFMNSLMGAGDLNVTLLQDRVRLTRNFIGGEGSYYGRLGYPNVTGMHQDCKFIYHVFGF